MATVEFPMELTTGELLEDLYKDLAHFRRKAKHCQDNYDIAKSHWRHIRDQILELEHQQRHTIGEL